MYKYVIKLNEIWIDLIKFTFRPVLNVCGYKKAIHINVSLDAKGGGVSYTQNIKMNIDQATELQNAIGLAIIDAGEPKQ